MAHSDTPLRICGWMHFKHAETQERKSSPAIAIFLDRQVSWGERTRMGIELRSPFTDHVGTWEEIRHEAWAAGTILEAKKWSLVEFTPNDPSVKTLLTERIEGMLRDNPNEARKKRSADRRATSCRFDEWLKGWSVDLVWDPFKDLAPSAKVLLDMAEHGDIHADEDHLHWLDHPVATIPAKRSSFGSYAAKPPTGSASANAARSPAPAAVQEAAPTPAAARSSEPEQHGDYGMPTDREPPDWGGYDGPANSEPIEIPMGSASGYPESYPDMEDIPFQDEPPFSIDEPDARRERATPAGTAPTVEREEPSPTTDEPQASSPSPMPAPAGPSTQTPTPSEPPRPEMSSQPDSDEEPLSAKQLLERDIFSGPGLPSFSSIARAAGTTLQRPQAAAAAQEQRAGSQEPTAAPWRERQNCADPKKTLRIAFARFPLHGDDGSIAWESALVHCLDFMEADAFNASKRHRVATRSGSGRPESLYQVGILADLARIGIPIELEGRPIDPRHVKQSEHGPELDVENLCLSAMAKSTFGPASNIAALARVRYHRERAMAILSGAQREPCNESPAKGWIQVSQGQDRPEGTRYQPEAGLVRWAKPGSDLSLTARIADPEARAALAKACQSLSAAFVGCHPASPEPDGPMAPGSAPVELLARGPRPGGRR